MGKRRKIVVPSSMADEHERQARRAAKALAAPSAGWGAILLVADQPDRNGVAHSRESLRAMAAKSPALKFNEATGQLRMTMPPPKGSA